MEENRPNIDQLIQSSFDSFEPQLPNGIWNNIDDQLNQKDLAKRKVIFGWSSVAAVVIIGLSGMLFFNMPDNASVGIINENSSINNESHSKSTNNKITQNSNLENGLLSNSDNKELSGPKISNSVKSRSTNSPNNFITKSTLHNNKSLNSGFSNSEILVKSEDVDLISELKSEEDYNSFFEDLTSKDLELTNTTILQLPASSQIPQKPTKQKRSIWAFEVGYDQNQTAINYVVEAQLSQYVHKNFINRMKQSEFALAAPQLHLVLRYQLNPNWSVSTGLGYSQTRISQNFNFQDSTPVSLAQGNEADINGNYPIFGYAGLGIPVLYSGNQTISMISVPVNLGYQKPINRTWSFSSELSLRYNKITTTAGKTLDYHDLSLIDGLDYRKQIWSAKMSVGAEKRVSLRDIWGVRLNTQGALTPFNTVNSPVSNRGWSLGMSVFYRYSIW